MNSDATDRHSATHTPGPWRWELNKQTKHLSLVGGKPLYDLTIIQPTRWGMGSATLLIRDTAHDGLQLLHKLHERADWVKPFHGREHHAHWCSAVAHPNMRLIESAPDLLKAPVGLLSAVQRSVCDGSGPAQEVAAKAIRKATE